VRVGPILGLMGTLIPLSPALIGLASGDTTQLAENLTTAFSVTVIGLLIGGIAFVISIVRDRMYSQDISDMEYLLELLEGGSERLDSGRRRNKNGIWDTDPAVEYEAVEDTEKTTVIPVLLETPSEPLIPFACDDSRVAPVAAEDSDGTPAPPMAAPGDVDSAAMSTPVVAPPVDPLAAEVAAPTRTPVPTAGEAPPLTFDDPAMDWQRDEDPFADLGPVDPDPPAGGASRPDAGAPPSRR
jgi:hypothetical protein